MMVMVMVQILVLMVLIVVVYMHVELVYMHVELVAFDDHRVADHVVDSMVEQLVVQVQMFLGVDQHETMVVDIVELVVVDKNVLMLFF
jgi:hypothetical protein